MVACGGNCGAGDDAHDRLFPSAPRYLDHGQPSFEAMVAMFLNIECGIAVSRRLTDGVGRSALAATDGDGVNRAPFVAADFTSAGKLATGRVGCCADLEPLGQGREMAVDSRPRLTSSAVEADAMMLVLDGIAGSAESTNRKFELHLRASSALPLGNTLLQKEIP